ncbi:MAG: flagellin N-terminal helical domain-containing protein [Planctomycetota bacterium]|jgi:flagellin
MGLRINSDVGALNALRNLRSTARQQTRNFERLSTGLAINRGSDNPAAMVLSNMLAGQLASIQQASENTQNALNMTDVADAALEQVSNQLVGLRADIVASMNTGTLGSEAQRAMEQSIAMRLSSIDRIGATTRYAGQNLLNGELGYNVTDVSPEIENVTVHGGDFPVGVQRTFEVTVGEEGGPAVADGVLQHEYGPHEGHAARIRISGPKGEATFIVSATSLESAIRYFNEYSADDNDYRPGDPERPTPRELTGVYATSDGRIRTEEEGSDASFTLEYLKFDWQTGEPQSYEEFAEYYRRSYDYTDEQLENMYEQYLDYRSRIKTLPDIKAGTYTGTGDGVTVNGEPATRDGNTVIINTASIQAEITLQPGATGTFSFTVDKAGAVFQLGPSAGSADRATIGIPQVSTGTLGRTSTEGSLRDLMPGGAASAGNDPARALRILDAATTEVSSLRGRVGAFAAQTLEPNMDALDVAFENLSASLSVLRDADMAGEIAEQVRLRLLRETGISALHRSNVLQGAALRLLT